MKEYDIRPKDVFEEYINLCKEDAISYFSKVKKYFTNCPACDSKELKQAFVKYSFSYYECIECKTLFVNPMPEEEAFIKYYKNSKSAKFWASDFYKKTEKARIKNLVKPKVLLCLDLLVRYSNNLECVVDIGAGYGSFLQEFSKKSKLKTLAIEPSLDLSEVIKSKGLNVISKFLENVKSEDLPNLRKCFFSFELFEHLSRPKKFISSLYSIMKKGDLFIFTTLSSMGIDIRLLWENSKSIFPPHHINFFNPKSISFFLSNLGFEILNISTPGKLDIDILLNNKDYIDDGGGDFL